MARKRTPKRRETQFFPQSAANPILIRLLGAVGAVSLGAGMWEQFGANHEPVTWTPYLLAGGAAIFGAAIWFGTSGDLIVRVGHGGVGVDRGGVTRRIPWYQISKIAWDETLQAVVVKGDDEAGAPLTITVKLKSQLHAAAWLVTLAEERAAKALDIPESVIERLPKASELDGLEVALDPVQVVGKRCAKTDKVIAYEPDGRVCPRCERVYHKSGTPKKCACGQDLTALRRAAEDESNGDDGSDADEPDADEDEAPDSDAAPPPPAKHEAD